MTVFIRTGRIRLPLTILNMLVPVVLPTVLSVPVPAVNVTLGASVALPNVKAPPLKMLKLALPTV